MGQPMLRVQIVNLKARVRSHRVQPTRHRLNNGSRLTRWILWLTTDALALAYRKLGGTM